MKKILFVLLIILMSISCETENLVESDKVESEFKRFSLHAGILSFNQEMNTSEVISLSNIMKENSIELSDEYSLDKVTKTEMADSYMYLIPSASIEGKFHAFVFTKSMEYIKDFEFSYKQKPEETTVTIMSKGNRTEIAVLANGNLKSIESENILANGKIVFCQREGSEGFSDCYKREMNEFCDGFIGCLALLHWGSHAALAATCSC